MSRQRRQIEAAAKSKGFRVREMQWTPIGQMVEMSGREGGWWLLAERDGEYRDAFGYNADEVVAYINECWIPVEGEER